MDKPKILTTKELRTIMPRLSGWKLTHNKLSRTFEFQDFVQRSLRATGHRQEWKRERIERGDRTYRTHVDSYPRAEPYDVQDEHRAAACGAHNPIAELLDL